MLKRPVNELTQFTAMARANAAVSAKRFEAVDDLIDRCEAISHQVANQSTGTGRIAA